jgi:hypothetical protein
MSQFSRVRQPKYTAEAIIVMPDPKNGCKRKQPKMIEKFQDNLDHNYIFGISGEINPDDYCNNNSKCANLINNDPNLINQCFPGNNITCPTGAFGVRGIKCQCPLTCQYINTRIAPTTCPTSSPQIQNSNQNNYVYDSDRDKIMSEDRASLVSDCDSINLDIFCNDNRSHQCCQQQQNKPQQYQA